ncbi:phage tail protein [Vibrio fluvialis]|nr:phage tail protein [Vibrio fluvialis]
MADENTDLRCYLTNAGIAAENNSIQLNRSLNVTEMVFGSGLLADEKDPREQTTMIKEEYAVPCALLFDEDTPTLLVFKGDLPADVGGFYINEVGIRLEDGTIYGYARGKGDYKPTLEQGATDSVRYAVEMYSSNAGNVVAKIDLSSVYADYEDIEATKKYADDKDAAHVASADPHTQYLTRADFLKHMLFKGMPMSVVGPDPDPDIWLPAGRVELLRADYPTVFEIVSQSVYFGDQATINANPRAYAGHWGNGDGETTFTTDDWGLMMNIKVAGGYGAGGSTKEDHIQNITASMTGFIGNGGVVAPSSPTGAFKTVSTGTNSILSGVSGQSSNYGFGFDASLVARTSNITDTMGLFLDHYRVIPKGVFSYV